MTQHTTDGGHIGALDGLRGLAALWVLLSHVSILAGMPSIPLLSWGGSAVDLFMMISGFLMAHHYLGRHTPKAWHAPRTWAYFWTKRWFRIAPAYFSLLGLALFIGPTLGNCRAEIATHFPWTATPSERYFDHSWRNVVAHLTFAFGLFPQFSFRTPLPDWSIGLEMQFYAALPFLMLLIGPSLQTKRTVLVVLSTIALSIAFRGFYAQFVMPSFLLIKLPVFMIGMLVAYGLTNADMRLPGGLIGLIALSNLLRHHDAEAVFFVFMALGFCILLAEQHLRGMGWLHQALALVRRALSSRYGILAGDYAYSIYLVHLIFLLPIAAMLLGQPWFEHLGAWQRWGLESLMVLPPCLLACWLLHHFVEQPGIKFGGEIANKFTTTQ